MIFDYLNKVFNILNMFEQNATKPTVIRTTEEIRQEFAVRGIAISDWARQMGYSPGLVHQVLSGRLKCIRGQSHDVAITLGLKKGKQREVDDLPFGKKGGVSTKEET